MKYAFIGTGGFAAACLERLCSWHTPEWIATSPARAAGRGNKQKKTPVAVLAESLPSLSGVRVFESDAASRDEAILSARRDSGVEFVFVTDHGQMIKEPLLGERDGVFCLNIHPSLLPRYRGAAPIQRAIMSGDDTLGVTVFKLEAGMDSGPILLQNKFSAAGMCAGAALDEAARIGVDAFAELARSTEVRDWRFTPQDHERATRAPKISRDEEHIVWNAPAAHVVSQIKALSPKPGAWTDMRGTRLKVLDADVTERRSSARPGTLDISGDVPTVAAADFSVALKSVQQESKRAQSAAEWKKGIRDVCEMELI